MALVAPSPASTTFSNSSASSPTDIGRVESLGTGRPSHTGERMREDPRSLSGPREGAGTLGVRKGAKRIPVPAYSSAATVATPAALASAPPVQLEYSGRTNSLDSSRSRKLSGHSTNSATPTMGRVPPPLPSPHPSLSHSLSSSGLQRMSPQQLGSLSTGAAPGPFPYSPQFGGQQQTFPSYSPQHAPYQPQHQYPHPQYPFIPSPHPNAPYNSHYQSYPQPPLGSPQEMHQQHQFQQHQAMLMQQAQYQQQQWQMEMMRGQRQQMGQFHEYDQGKSSL